MTEMLSPIGGMGITPNSPNPNCDSPAAKSKKNKTHQSIVPCSIRQLLTAESDEEVFMINNQEINKVIVLGQIENLQETSSSTGFRVRDDTGWIDAHLWESDEQESAVSHKKWRREGCYVRIVGTLKCFNGKTNLSAFAVFPVDDMNEITYHIAHVILVNLQMSGKLAIQSGASGSTCNPPFAVGPPVRCGGTERPPVPSNGTFKGPSQAPYNDSFHQHSDGQRGDISSKVKQVLDMNQTPEGMGFPELMMELLSQGTSYSEHQVRNTLEDLLDDASIYTTIDDLHWKAC